jgi:hypothetical protein
MSEKPTIFLSYAREDRARVEQVYDSLKGEGFNPWLDTRDIMAGEAWSEVIGQSIRSADCMLVFISRHSVSKRGYVQREIKAALSELAELPDGAMFLIPVRLDDSEPPETLRHLHYIDLFEPTGWNNLLKALRMSVVRGQVASEPLDTLRDEIRRADAAERQRGSRHVFVAMPFAVEMEDVYYYGIQRAIDANGLDAVRIDRSAFTGDILEQIKTSIRTAVAAVVELTGSNPNVHLELGYAWGHGLPTVLLLKEGGDLCFDVRGQKCIIYRTIKDLENALSKELATLMRNGTIARDA